MICPNCSFVNKNGSRFCGKCGNNKLGAVLVDRASSTAIATPFATRRHCPRCGAELQTHGTCSRCPSVPRDPLAADRMATPPTQLDLPKIPARNIGVVLGGLAIAGICIATGKALWGDSLLVRTNVPGAIVLVDGERKGKMPTDGVTPISIQHLHGERHTVLVTADGYQQASRDVVFPMRITAPLQLNLSPKPALIRLKGLPGSVVFVNGRFAGHTDSAGVWNSPSLNAAHYLLALRLDQHVEWSQDLNLKPGEEQDLTASQPEAQPSPEQLHAKAMAFFRSAQQDLLRRDFSSAAADCERGLSLDSASPQGNAICNQLSGGFGPPRGER